MDGSSRTFRVNFSGDGLAKLRNRVTEKLKEFMGDYTDDTLVEYVIVLLRNGRQKEEAMKELNVFLGDDSVSFVTWLWDHLTFNLHLYVPQRESSVDDQTKYSVKQSSELEHGSGDMQSDPDYDQESSAKSKVRHNREWKGLVHEKPEPFLLRSTLIDDIRSAEKPVHRHSPVRPIRHSPSLRPQIHKKRSRQDEEPAPKREIASRPMLDAPRRLLQFAVRDAVRTVQKTSSKPGPVLKRLRSVVSTSTVDDLPHDDELPNRTRYLAVAPRAVATAIKAAAEAAEDVVKGRSSGNVFDRLSHGSVRPQINNQSTNFEAHVVEDENDEDFYQRSKHVEYRERDEYNGSGRDMPIVERSIEMACDSGSENDAYEDLSTLSSRVDASQSASYVPKMKDLPLMQHSNFQNANDTGKNTTVNDEDSSVATASNVSQKIVDISVNLNTCKPQNYQVPGEIATVGNHMAVQKTGENITMLDARLSNDNNATSGTNENGSPRQADAQKDVQKAVPSIHGSYSSGRPSDDADSRTIFVSNVHFAATKDTLSRHFNKFGEVLKVIIVTDAATGQPKGSAYVEFLRKESAELALSLNNTSFMSRLLKVVRRSAAHHEPSAMASWPRGISRASAFAPRLGRMSYPRGIMGATFRARLPVKHGARSLQWKRDSPSTPANDGSKASQSYVTPGNTANSSTGKNLTYVRPDPKADSSVSLS